MSLINMYLSELESEAEGTRKTLERVPSGKFDWRPHPKSMTFGHLANHLATIPSWVKPTVEQDSLDFAPTDGSKYESPPEAKTAEDLVTLFDKGMAQARECLAKADDAVLPHPWTLRAGEKIIFTQPKSAVLRGIILNHLVHHRAQLGVYLRLNDIPLPSIYGPSADEGSFG